MKEVVFVPELPKVENGVEAPLSQLSRCSISLFVAQAYLEGLSTNACRLFEDPEFSSAFNALRTRLNAMIDSVGDSSLDVLDIYCIVERGKDPVQTSGHI